MSNLRIATAVVMLLGTASSYAADNTEQIFRSTPTGYVSVGVVVLQRSDPDGGPIITEGLASTPVLVDPDDYDFGWQAGIDASAGVNFLTNETIEARFLYLDTDASSQFTTTSGYYGVGFTGPAGTGIASDYETELRSWEVNWRHRQSEQFSFLAGIRGIDIKDELLYRIDPTDVPDIRSEYRYDNDLLGAQIGAEWSVLAPSNPFQLNLAGKIGAYSLESEGGVATFFPGPLSELSSSVDDTVYAGELGILAAYRPSENVKIGLGYQLLWISDVGLASNNAAASREDFGVLREAVARDDLYFHGFNLGMTVSW